MFDLPANQNGRFRIKNSAFGGTILIIENVNGFRAKCCRYRYCPDQPAYHHPKARIRREKIPTILQMPDS